MNPDSSTNSISWFLKKKNNYAILNVGDGARVTWFGQEAEGGCGDMREEYTKYVHLKRMQMT